MSQGLYFACNDPTALTLTIHATPSFFMAQMLARWLSSLGRIRCPRPCLGKKTTSRSAIVPVRKSSEAAPNGVFTFTHFCLEKPSIEYRPLPPIIPIFGVFFIRKTLAEDAGESKAADAGGTEERLSRSEAVEPR